jgi:hypothetical protein
LIGLLSATIAAALFLPAVAHAAGPAPEIWVTPQQPSDLPGTDKPPGNDFFRLFPADAPWPTVAGRVAVFKIYLDVVRHASDDELRSIFQGLSARHIGLALEAQTIADTGACGAGAQPSRWMLPLVERLKRLGADLRIVAMDEPLAYGHSLGGPGRCRAPITQVAADVAKTVAAFKEMYPGLIVGDIEPIGARPDLPNAADIATWIKAYRDATGTQLAFFHLDIDWGTRWEDSLVRVAAAIRTAGVPLGVIYDGDFHEVSDDQYARDTALHAEAIEHVLGGAPDQIVFQTWGGYPVHSLPEDAHGSMTGIVRDYLREGTRLEVAGTRAKLSDAAGRPVPNADVVLESHDPSPRTGMVPQVISGKIPERARSAIFAIRVNTECPCRKGAAKLAIGGVSFSGGGSPPALHSWDVRSFAALAPDKVHVVAGVPNPTVSIAVAPDQPLILNSPTFPIVPGSDFTLRFEWNVSPDAAGTGYAGLIFLDQDGKEMNRLIHPMEVTWRSVGRATTDTSGLTGPLNVSGSKNAPVRAVFTGDQKRKPVASDLDRPAR